MSDTEKRSGSLNMASTLDLLGFENDVMTILQFRILRGVVWRSEMLKINTELHQIFGWTDSTRIQKMSPSNSTWVNVYGVLIMLVTIIVL